MKTLKPYSFLATAPSAFEATYYWDNNDATTGSSNLSVTP